VIPKLKPYRNAAYLRFVRSHGCLVCGQAANGIGGADKTDGVYTLRSLVPGRCFQGGWDGDNS